MTGRRIVRVTIDEKIVKYFDDSGINLVFPKGLQILPKDNHTWTKLMRSGKKTFKKQADLISDANKGDNLKEYIACCNYSTKEEIEVSLASLIKLEFKMKGMMEVK